MFFVLDNKIRNNNGVVPHREHTQQFADKFSRLNSKINAFCVVKLLFIAMLLGRCYVGHERTQPTYRKKSQLVLLHVYSFDTTHISVINLKIHFMS